MNDLNLHKSIIQLIVAYTLVGAFVFTVVFTCFGLAIRHKNPRYFNALFTALILEVVAISVGFFSNFLQFNPKEAETEVKEPIRQALEVSDQSAERLRAATSSPDPTEIQAAQVPATTPEQAEIDTLVANLFSSSGRDRTVAYERLTGPLRTKDYAAAAILKRGDEELNKPADQRDFIGVYHTIVTLTDMSRAVTKKAEFRDRIVDYASRAVQAFPRLDARVRTLTRWVQP